MSSLNGLQGAPLQFNTPFTAEQGVQQLFGSFQGLAAAVSVANAAQVRGSWFTAQQTASGIYRVTLVGVNPNPALVPVQNVASTGVNGQSNGLLVEANAWLTTDTVKTAPTAANALIAICTKFDTTDNSFDIYFTGSTAAGAYAALPVAATMRINFCLTWKVVANLP